MLDRRTLLGAAVAAPAAALATRVAGTGAAGAAPADAQGVTTRQAAAWTEAYLAAWRARDPAAAGRLFSEGAVYEVIPGVADQTYTGRAAIEAYWAEVTSAQSDITTRAGAPVVTGNRAAVEVWVTLRIAGFDPPGGDWATIVEANLLTFDRAGLCTRNTEYYQLLTGRVAPPPGWGARR